MTYQCQFDELAHKLVRSHNQHSSFDTLMMNGADVHQYPLLKGSQPFHHLNSQMKKLTEKYIDLMYYQLNRFVTASKMFFPSLFFFRSYGTSVRRISNEESIFLPYIGSFGFLFTCSFSHCLFSDLGFMPAFLGSVLAFSLFISEEHTSELQSRGHLVFRLLLENK